MDRSARPRQFALTDLGTPLREVTFVVVDLETTGSGPGAHAITEIGAVRVRGGEVLDELSTLTNPGAVVPAQITALTGITNAMVATAPPLAQALATFLRWARLEQPDTILVAHNARFDVGHLRGACQALGLSWPKVPVADTLALARRAWSRTDVPNHRLGTLARFVGSPTSPTHRALDDARATVDVLHATLEVLAPLGVSYLEDLATATDPVPPARRAKSRLADGLPTGPGVYEFCSATGEVLYVGSAVNLRRRVRSYFTAAEKRSRVAQMLDTTVQVRHVPCPTEIEARVRELRLIDELDPPVNRRSRRPSQQPWLYLAGDLTGGQQRGGSGRQPAGQSAGRSAGRSSEQAASDERSAPQDPGARPHLATTSALPLSQVRSAVGPFPSRRAAQEAVRAAESVLRLQPWDGGRPGSGPDPSTARTAADQARRALGGETDLVAGPLLKRIHALSQAERFEEAGAWTQRLRSLLAAAARAEKARPLLTCPHLIAARRRHGGGWELVCVRWGRLAGSLVTPPGADPRPGVDTLRASAQAVERPARVGGAASVEETLLLADWVLDAGARLVEVAAPAGSEGHGGEGRGGTGDAGGSGTGDADGPAGGQAGGAGTDPYAGLTWPRGAAARHRRVLQSRERD